MSVEVPGGTFNRSNDSSFPATISAVRIDKYETTVGRFRRFVEAYPGSMPAAGSGKNPNNPNDPGFTFNQFLRQDQAGLIESLHCSASGETWSDTPLQRENLPINCVDWYTSYAFCIWDGGRLPTEAEWNFAAAGGGEQRPYPWSTSPTDEAISIANAVYSPAELAVVGSKSPHGDGRWGHTDLAGNLMEWTQDVEDDYLLPCNNCANFSAEGGVVRGGSFQDDPPGLLTSVRDSRRAPESAFNRGFRCARATGGSAGLETCNTLENSAELVTNRIIEDDPPMPPMPEGGTLVDGVYEITAVDIYDVTGTAMVDSRRRTVEIRYGGTIWDWVAEVDGVVSRVQAFYEAVDTELLVTTLCSTGPTLSPRYAYTASADRILTFNTDNLGRVTVNTFTPR